MQTFTLTQLILGTINQRSEWKMCVWHQTECEAPGCEWRWSVWAWQHLHNTNGSDKEDVLQCEAVCSQSSPPSPHCANINWHTVTRGRRAATRTQRDTAASPSTVSSLVATLETSSSITGQTPDLTETQPATWRRVRVRACYQAHHC